MKDMEIELDRGYTFRSFGSENDYSILVSDLRV
jgi:hypothetical protein